MLIKPSPDVASSEITDRKHYLSRRGFLQAAGITAATVAAGVVAAESALEASGAPHGRKLANINRAFPKPDEKINSWDDITSYNNFYEFGMDKSDAARRSRQGS